jgi:hypothetical protein
MCTGFKIVIHEKDLTLRDHIGQLRITRTI